MDKETPEPVSGEEGASEGHVSEDMVPKARLDREARIARERKEELEAVRLELAEMRGQIQGLGKKETPEVSRADLLQAVDEGRITQADADARWERQLETKILGKAEDLVSQRTETQSRLSRVEAEIEAYKQAIPGVMDEGSEERAKVARNYRRLVNDRGLPQSRETEALALEMAFGSVERLSKVQSEPRETHNETGGGDRPAEPLNQGEPKELSRDERNYYRDKVGPGKMYKDWKAAVEEVTKYGNPHLRKRMGA